MMERSGEGDHKGDVLEALKEARPTFTGTVLPVSRPLRCALTDGAGGWTVFPIGHALVRPASSPSGRLDPSQV